MERKSVFYIKDLFVISSFYLYMVAICLMYLMFYYVVLRFTIQIIVRKVENIKFYCNMYYLLT